MEQGMVRTTLPEDEADGHGKVTGSCGDTIEIFVKVDRGRVTWAHHRCTGCMYTAACAIVAARAIEDKTLAEARRAVRPELIDQALGGLPRDHLHCAALATHAVLEAIDDAIVVSREPWRKVYRRS